ncbi:MAG: prepilin-type N-terminal cleavage/methylation domain-containing protein [Bdellovibrionaceae bacterium]|nr:prepilin-type N-terminal cleavage/methylation domain-containing protein [Pseudobdellovibrionaceae bacterium]
MVKHLGKAGFSLVEIMIAAAILAIIVGSTLTIMSTSGHNTTFQTKIESNDACLSEAHKIIENIKQKGQARVRLSMPVSLLSTTSPPYNFTAAGTDQLGNSNQEAGVTFSDRWPTTDPIYELSGTVYTVRPYLLSMGYMNTLQALYNSNLGFCSNTRGLSSYGDGTIIGNTTSDSLTSSTSYLKIQHFSTTTGATYGGCTAFDIRPPGADEANFGTNVQDPPELNGTKYRDMHPNSVNYRIANKDSTAAINAGFLVTASVTYLDRKGQTQECRVQEKFQYGHNRRTI